MTLTPETCIKFPCGRVLNGVANATDLIKIGKANRSINHFDGACKTCEHFKLYVFSGKHGFCIGITGCIGD